MQTEKDLINGLNRITRELRVKQHQLKELKHQLQTPHRRVLILEIKQLKNQRQTLENLLVIE